MWSDLILPSLDESTTYEEVVSGFEWTIPSTLNIASTIEKTGDERSRQALIHVTENDNRTEFTYDEIDRAAGQLASHLADAGVGRGDRIAVCFPQSPELLIAHLAGYRLGSVLVPLSVLFGTKTLGKILDGSGTETIIADDQIFRELETTVGSLDVENSVVVETGPNDYRGPDRHLGGYGDEVETDRGTAVAKTAPDDPALIGYSSGTSGDPKGIVQGHQYLLGTLPGYQCWFHCFGPTHRERVWSPVEWSWAGALFDVVFPTLAQGGTVVSRCRREGFDPEQGLAIMERCAVSRAFFPPTALWKIREQASVDAFDLSQLEIVLCGGEKLAEPLRRWTEKSFDVIVNEGYGLTEANALVGNCHRLFPRRQNSMGRPYPGHDCVIVDEDGTQIEDDEIGQIAVRRPDPTVFLGYWKDPERTEQVMTEDGLFLTGDLAWRDSDGYFYYAGRTDELIISSGYRVSPTELESTLSEVPYVIDAAVGGVPDEQRGERIKAYVMIDEQVDRDGATIEDALQQHARAQLGAHKTPHKIVPLTDPPQTRTGKIDRSALFPD